MLAAIALAFTAAVLIDGDEFDKEKHFDENHRRAVERDEFPVFNNPSMLSAIEAEQQNMVKAQDLVLGVAHGDESKAYPIPVLGTHELGNDTIDGIPIAVSW